MQILHIASGKNTGANMTERAVRKSIPLGADYTANEYHSPAMSDLQNVSSHRKIFSVD